MVINRGYILMNEYLLYGIIALIVIVILAFIFLKVMKNKQPKQVSAADIPVDVNSIIEAVGGKTNIKETTATSSKVTFLLSEISILLKSFSISKEAPISISRSFAVTTSSASSKSFTDS